VNIGMVDCFDRRDRAAERFANRDRQRGPFEQVRLVAYDLYIDNRRKT